MDNINIYLRRRDLIIAIEALSCLQKIISFQEFEIFRADALLTKTLIDKMCKGYSSGKECRVLVSLYEANVLLESLSLYEQQYKEELINSELRIIKKLKETLLEFSSSYEENIKYYNGLHPEDQLEIIKDIVNL